jgi:hypothetical protein
MFDDRDKEMIIPEIKREIEDALHAIPELTNTKGIFLISSREPELGEISDLLRYVEENGGGIKTQAWYYHLLVSVIKHRVVYIYVDL